MAETGFDEWIAERYERLWPELFDPAVLDPAVDMLADLAAAGPVLEFGVGTGRIALPLSRRGIPVHGIELSAAMVARLRAQADGGSIGVTVGDFATATVTAGGRFTLVYLLRNTITNLTTQDEQVSAFGNAAAHLDPGGCFLIENYVPELRRLPPGDTRHVFAATANHVGVEEYDVAAQLAVSRHYWTIEGQLRTFSSTHRYVWPSELDLMARIAGLRLRHRWADWHHTPFTSESRATSPSGRSPTLADAARSASGLDVASTHAPLAAEADVVGGRGHGGLVNSWREVGTRCAGSRRR